MTYFTSNTYKMKEMFYQTVYDDLEKKMLLVVYNKRKKSHYMEAAWSLK